MSDTTTENESGPKVPASPSPSSHKIMVVDDEQKFLTLIMKVFRSVGFQVDTCDDPERALELIDAKGPYAVVISDNRMKGIRGTEFLSTLRKSVPETVRILATAYYDNSLLEEAINNAEPYRFLKKPIDYKLMIKAVQESLRKYEENLETRKLIHQINKLNKEKQSAKVEFHELETRVGKLKKSLRLVCTGLAMVVVCSVAVLGALQIVQGWQKEDKSIRVENWIIYPNQTALESDSKKMWMTVDFRNIEGRAPKNWNEVIGWMAKMNKKKFAGFSDWRLPTIEEYKVTYDPQLSKVGYDRREDLRVGYPKVFEDGGGFGFWAADDTGPNSAAYFFFIGGYDKVVARNYESPAMSVRLIREE